MNQKKANDYCLKETNANILMCTNETNNTNDTNGVIRISMAVN